MSGTVAEIDFDAVWQQVEAGYINVQAHPETNLRIFNYSQRAQFDWHWTPETKACRGLIVDGGNRVVARPFEKFFSYEQLGGVVPCEPFEAFEKMDGSLGVLYWVNDEPYIATRGSFTGEQAAKGTEILRRKYAGVELDRSLTYLFEIIYPGNRIVVDYGGREDLVLLAVIRTDDGAEQPLPEIGFPVVKRYDGITDFAELLETQDDGREGFVVRFESGQRVKIKFAEYKRLHRLLTGVGPKHVWDALRSGTDLDAVLDRVPDEYYDWVRRIESELRKEYDRIESDARRQMRYFSSRKEAAAHIKECGHPSVMFAMLDGKDYSDVIWRMIRPKGQQVFRCDIDL